MHLRKKIAREKYEQKEIREAIRFKKLRRQTRMLKGKLRRLRA